MTCDPPNVNFGLPSTAQIVSAVGICSPGAPEDLAGAASRESWPADEPASDARGTLVFVHGRAGRKRSG